jgi:hypothetical protein
VRKRRSYKEQRLSDHLQNNLEKNGNQAHTALFAKTNELKSAAVEGGY